MKRILSFFLVAIFFGACEPSTSFIIGKWRDENSVIDYKEDGNFVGTWNENSTRNGTWELNGDTLTMSFSFTQSYDYLVVKKSKKKFRIKSLSDGTLFNKTRVLNQ